MRFEEYINEWGLFSGEGEEKKISIDGSEVEYELVKSNKEIYIHDVYVQTDQRRKGMGTELVKRLLLQHKGYNFWCAASSKGMVGICKKLNFQKISAKHFKNLSVPVEQIPDPVKFDNAEIYYKGK